jgi:hypothetical protein
MACRECKIFLSSPVSALRSTILAKASTVLQYRNMIRSPFAPPWRMPELPQRYPACGDGKRHPDRAARLLSPPRRSGRCGHLVRNSCPHRQSVSRLRPWAMNFRYLQTNLIPRTCRRLRKFAGMLTVEQATCSAEPERRAHPSHAALDPK